MKKILVTGAAGFIGSHLVEKLMESGYSVKAFIHYNSMNTQGWLEESKVQKQCEIIAGDIRDYDSVSSAVKGVDAIFHLAALIGIPYSYVSPLAYIRTNIEGTYNILQSALKHGTENVMITSTSETYGTAQYVPIDEKHPLVGQSPYSATKISSDQLAISYYRSFNLPVKILRPFNTFGPRQSARSIIPSVILQILNKQNTIECGSIHPTRDFTFVKDTVKGFIHIGESDILFGEVINIGMNKEISIGDLISLIAELMNAKVEIIQRSQRIRPEKSEVERLCCDNAKLLENTSWSPNYTIKQGLLETILWFKSHKEQFKSELYNV